MTNKPEMKIDIKTSGEIGCARVIGASGGLAHIKWVGDMINMESVGLSRVEVIHALMEIDGKVVDENA